MILVGTSGFSFKDWKGRFYPLEIRQGDMLSFYATRFPMVEINYSYYQIPAPSTMRAMASRVPDQFEFVVKLHKTLTHQNSVIGSLLRGDDAPSPSLFSASPSATGGFDQIEKDISAFKSGVDPLVSACKLGCVLAQFPWGFKNTAANRDYVTTLASYFQDYPFVVEFRNSEWVSEEVFGLLREARIGFCCVDEPRLKGLFPPVAVSTSPDVSYVRFHGRNGKNWWKRDDSSDRYDYLYSEDELLPWVEKIRRLDSMATKTYVLFNNCHEGQAAQNAAQMQALLGLLDYSQATPESEQGCTKSPRL